MGEAFKGALPVPLGIAKEHVVTGLGFRGPLLVLGGIGVPPAEAGAGGRRLAWRAAVNIWHRSATVPGEE